MAWPKGVKRPHGRHTRMDGSAGGPKTPVKATTRDAPATAPAKSGHQRTTPGGAANQTRPASEKRVPRELSNILNPWFLDGPRDESDDNEGASSGDEEQDLPQLSPKFQQRPLPPLPPLRNNHTPREQRAARRDWLRTVSFHDQDDDDDDDSDDSYPSSYNGSTRRGADMSSQQGKWREEQVLIICPGSKTTMAQLGCGELTPPAHRIPTRMFKDDETGEYLPYHTFKRKKNGAANGAEGTKLDEDDYEYVEDRDSVEGAVYPIVGGRIVNMAAFLAFLDHVHSLLTTTYHNTPIVLMASPQWSRLDWEAIARYIFEKTKTPALCLIHSAVAAQYGIKWPHMTVVDIGFEKVDVTCLYDNIVVGHKQLGFPRPDREISGGDVFTKKLLALLKDKGFTYDMAEQLKTSPLCEVLPYAADLDELMELPTETGAPYHPLGADAPKFNEPPKPAPQIGAEDDNGIVDDKTSNEEGVLDVANIVTSGNTREFLAKKEKEKAERAAKAKKGKGQEAEAAAAKPVRLPNSKRKYATFHYEELVHEDVEVPVSNGNAPPAAPSEPANGDSAPSEAAAANGEDSKASAVGDTATELPFAAEVASSVTERRTRRVKKDIEIGLERFLFADRGEIDRITTTIYQTIQSIEHIYKRSSCWDNIVFVGNGSRLKGLKENIMQTLHARHLISPSTATIFTSELPSNMATPTGTGSQTPTGSFTGQLPTSSSVNPLLQAATTASLGIPGSTQAPGSTAGDGPSHQSHAQTPTSIKMATLPSYLAEWTKNGFEEAPFLGSLIAARLVYCIHNLDAATQEAQRGCSLSRVEYNELGPKAIRTFNLIG
ncbi:hypothetical protein JX265_012980 [Neoarthrinium moseri]|uniref:Uncharacterized protein n=1 Tax=Neoarthrinium moseri TaxID=1658444 RepID=A0A9P9W9F8_9PEZI|nr:hypothetical protein JX265_012980 [Neoarthrinium moseri]